MPKPIYVLHGDDSYLLDSHRKRIVQELIGDADPQLCVSSYDAQAAIADVLADLRTLPFLAPRRVVLVRDADAFVSANREALEKYLSNPCATASLVLLTAAWPANTNLAKTTARIGEAVSCEADENADLVPWVTEEASRLGKKIDRPAAASLVELAGRGRSGLKSELEKLAAYVGARPAITADDVSEMTAASAAPVDFALTNALAEGKADAALLALDDLLATKGAEFLTLGQIASHLRTALALQGARQAGQDARNAFSRPLHPFVLRKLQPLLQKRPLRKLQQDFGRLIAADLAMKSGANPTAAMQQLVVQLCL